MKKFLLLLLAVNASAAISVITGGSNMNCSTQASPCNNGAGVTMNSGDAVVGVVAIATANSSDQTVSLIGQDSRISPTFTDTYVQYQAKFDATMNRKIVLFKLGNPHSAGLYSFTVSWSGGVNAALDFYYIRIGGASLGTDGVPSSAGQGVTASGTSVTASAITTTNANDIWISAVTGTGFLCDLSFSTGFTTLAKDVGFANVWSGVGYYIGSATETRTASLSTSGCSIGMVFATWPLKDVGGDGGGAARRRSLGIGTGGD